MAKDAKAPAKGEKMQALYALHWMPNLTLSARTVGAWLVWHANATTGRCDPGQARLRDETGLAERSIQYAIKSLIAAGVVSRRLRGTETASYRLNWKLLSSITREYEEKAKERDAPIIAAGSRRRGVQKSAPPGAISCAYPVQKFAPKPYEENSSKKTHVPGGHHFEGNGAVSDAAMAAKLLAIDADHAFLAALDREAQRGGRFSAEDAERLYARLHDICGESGHTKGDPLAGRAYRLLETDLTRESA